MPDYITTKHGVMVPAVAFEEAVKAAPELQEIASIGRDITQRFFGTVLTNQDDTLLTRGGGKGLKIYDDLERDAHAYSVLQKRKLAVIARPWTVAAASDSAQDKAAAELVTRALGGIAFDRICMELLDATNKGFSVSEVMWKIDGGELLPADVIARAQTRFTFGKDRSEQWGGHPLRLLTRESTFEGVEMPLRKFVVHRFGGKDGSPYGLGLGNKLFWPVFFKRQDIGFWLTFADKFGMPTALGKYPRGAQKSEQDKLLQSLRAIANDVGIIVPAGTEIELVEAARSGSIDTYEKLARYMDEQMSECVLGETMTTSAQGAGLGSGQANVHNEVREEVAKADADLLSDTLNATLVKWVVDYNLPGTGYPKVARNFEIEEDLNARSERDQRITQMGFEPTEQYILETYGTGWKKSTTPRPVPGPFNGPQFAEGESAQRAANRASQDALATAAEQLSAEWQKFIGPRVEDIISMMEQTNDLVELRARLAELLDREPPKEFVDALAQAGFTAHLAGRTDRSRPA